MAIDYQLWLSANGNTESFLFPVLPETFTVSEGSSNSSVDVVGVGEIVVKQARPAIQIQFSSFFPKHKFKGVIEQNFSDPLVYVNAIKEWKNAKKPVRLTLSKLNVNMYCTIEQFNYYEQGGDVGTIHYDITFKEYREVTSKQVKVDLPAAKATVSNTQTRVDNTVKPKTYTVKSGDCLWNIAKMFYGNGSQYTKIYNANKDKIKNQNLIYAGQVLIIP